MSLSNEQLEADLTEALTHIKMLERECEQMESDLEFLTNELTDCNAFKKWLAEVYPTALNEYEAVQAVEEGV